VVQPAAQAARSRVSGAGVSRRIEDEMSAEVSPVNGRRPATSS
jgi:hypothetical protein